MAIEGPARGAIAAFLLLIFFGAAVATAAREARLTDQILAQWLCAGGQETDAIRLLKRDRRDARCALGFCFSVLAFLLILPMLF